MIVKCCSDIRKFSVAFKKGEYCVAEKINDKIMSIRDQDFNRGFTIRTEDFKNNFEYAR